LLLYQRTKFPQYDLWITWIKLGTKVALILVHIFAGLTGPPPPPNHVRVVKMQKTKNFLELNRGLHEKQALFF